MHYDFNIYKLVIFHHHGFLYFCMQYSSFRRLGVPVKKPRFQILSSVLPPVCFDLRKDRHTVSTSKIAHKQKGLYTKQCIINAHYQSISPCSILSFSPISVLLKRTVAGTCFVIAGFYYNFKNVRTPTIYSHDKKFSSFASVNNGDCSI